MDDGLNNRLAFPAARAAGDEGAPKRIAQRHMRAVDGAQPERGAAAPVGGRGRARWGIYSPPVALVPDPGQQHQQPKDIPHKMGQQYPRIQQHRLARQQLRRGLALGVRRQQHQAAEYADGDRHT